MITKEEIKKMASLARMELEEKEIESLTLEVDSILGYVGQVSNISGNLKNEVSETHNVLRSDIPQNEKNQYTEDILNNAPSREGNYLKVKKILGNSDDII